MKLKLTYVRSPDDIENIVLTTEASATIGAIAREIIECDPLTASVSESSTVTLAVSLTNTAQPVVLDPGRALGDAPIVSGSQIRVVGDTPSVRRDRAIAATMRILNGTDAGQQVNLPPGSSVIGRDGSADVVLNDSFVSKKHARIDVSNTIELVDLNSANGISVDGQIVSRSTVLTGQIVELGDTQLTFSLVENAPTVQAHQIHACAIPFNRSPRVEPRFNNHELRRPVVPTEIEPPGFPWLMMIAPMLLGAGMFAITRNPISLMFIAMAPLMMTGSYITTRQRDKKKLASEFEKQFADVEKRLTERVPVEHAIRQSEIPAVTNVYESAFDRSDLLWSRRPEHWSFMNLRLGTAELESRTTLAPVSGEDKGVLEFLDRTTELEDRFRRIPDLPVIEDVRVAGALGVVGDRTVAADAVRAMLVQLAGLHSPAEVVFAAAASPTETLDYSWLTWLPHTSSGSSPLESGIHLADSQVTVAGLVSSLEQLASRRISRKQGEPPEKRGPLSHGLAATAAGGTLGEKSESDATVSSPELKTPVVVLLITEDAPIDRSRPLPSQVLGNGAPGGLRQRQHIHAERFTLADAI